MIRISTAEGAPSVSEFRIQIRYGGRFSIQSTADQRRRGTARSQKHTATKTERAKPPTNMTFAKQIHRANFPLPFSLIRNDRRAKFELSYRVTSANRAISSSANEFRKQNAKKFLKSSLHERKYRIHFFLEIKFPLTGNISFYFAWVYVFVCMLKS